jgi:hypothetical protein
VNPHLAPWDPGAPNRRPIGPARHPTRSARLPIGPAKLPIGLARRPIGPARLLGWPVCQLIEPARQFMQWNVNGPGDVALFPFQPAADVKHDRTVTVPVSERGGQVPERDHPQRGDAALACPRLWAAGGRGGGPVDADPGELPLGQGNLFPGIP